MSRTRWRWRVAIATAADAHFSRPQNYVPPPPARAKFCSENDEIMLEDESGRVRLIGPAIEEHAGKFVTGKLLPPFLAVPTVPGQANLVFRHSTGTTVAALGRETKEGDFHVFELLYAGLPPQPARTAEAASGEGEWVALLSGLALGGSEAAELKGALLAEWLTGELGGEEDGAEAVKVTRLILAGNSLAQSREEVGEDKKPVSWAGARRRGGGWERALTTAVVTADAVRVRLVSVLVRADSSARLVPRLVAALDERGLDAGRARPERADDASAALASGHPPQSGQLRGLRQPDQPILVRHRGSRVSCRTIVKAEEVGRGG